MCDMFDFLQDNDDFDNGDADQIGYDDDYLDAQDSDDDDYVSDDPLEELILSDYELDHLDELDEREHAHQDDMHEGQVSFCGDTISCSDCSGSCAAYCASMNSQA